MKKLTICIVLALLCLDFSAQSQGKQGLRPLKIGDTIPNITLRHVLNAPSDSIRFSDLKGKLVIIDFWATWCSPCVAMRPRMDSLQAKFSQRLQFLPVAYQTEKEIKQFNAKNAKASQYTLIPEVTEDKQLTLLFPHRSLPHYVWIGTKGEVIAVTELKDVTEANVRTAIATGSLSVRQKIDVRVPYTSTYPIFLNGNAGNVNNLFFHSILTGYTPGIGSGASLKTDSLGNYKITHRNESILKLLSTAYAKGLFFPDSRVIQNVKRPEDIYVDKSGLEYTDWMAAGHAYCYELRVPARLKSQAFDLMQRDLQLLFPDYRASLQTRAMPCLVLVRTSEEERYRYKDGAVEKSYNRNGYLIRGGTFTSLTTALELIDMAGHKKPIINGTGYTGLIDMDIQAPMNNVSAVNEQLGKYGLKIVQKAADVKVLVIEDNPQHEQPQPITP